MQRFFDIIFSGLAILLLAPILVPIIFVLLFSGEEYFMCKIESEKWFQNNQFV